MNIIVAAAFNNFPITKIAIPLFIYQIQLTSWLGRSHKDKSRLEFVGDIASYSSSATLFELLLNFM